MRPGDGGPCHAPLILVIPADTKVEDGVLERTVEKLKAMNGGGMSLRDYFAAHAPEMPPTMLANAEEQAHQKSGGNAIEAQRMLAGLEATWRFRFSRAMLRTREFSEHPGEIEILRELYEVAKRADGFDGNEAVDMMIKLENFYGTKS